MPEYIITIGYICDAASFVACLSLLIIYFRLPNDAKQGLPSCMLNLTICDLLCAVSLALCAAFPGADNDRVGSAAHCEWVFWVFMGLCQCQWFFTLTISLHAHGCVMKYLNCRITRKYQKMGLWVVEHQYIGWIIPVVLPLILYFKLEPETIFSFKNIGFCEPSNSEPVKTLCKVWVIVCSSQLLLVFLVHVRTWALARQSLQSSAINELLLFSCCFTTVCIFHFAPTIYLAIYFFLSGQYPGGNVYVSLWLYICIPLSGFMNTSIYIFINKRMRTAAFMIWHGHRFASQDSLSDRLSSLDGAAQASDYGPLKDIVYHGKHCKSDWSDLEAIVQEHTSHQNSIRSKKCLVKAQHSWGKFIYDKTTNSYYKLRAGIPAHHQQMPLLNPEPDGLIAQGQEQQQQGLGYTDN